MWGDQVEAGAFNAAEAERKAAQLDTELRKAAAASSGDPSSLLSA
jgi:hypothetical protein